MSTRETVLRMCAAQFPHWLYPWDAEMLAEAKSLEVDPGLEKPKGGTE